MKQHSISQYETIHSDRVSRLMARTRRDRRERCSPIPPISEDSPDPVQIPDAPGAVALSEEGTLGGFLFARRIDDPVWGTYAIARSDDWVLSPGIDPGATARLYASAFGAVAGGAARHLVHCPASDAAALDAWFHLGFGMEQAYAVASLRDMTVSGLATPGPSIAGLEIRRASVGDEDVLESLAHLIAAAQAAPPVWAGAPAAYLDGLREGFRGLAADENAIVLLAFLDGVTSGYQAWFPMEFEEGERRPWWAFGEGAVELSVGATSSGARGRGIGRALTAAGVAEALDRGYALCYTDWRTANPLSSTFWPSRGFQVFEYRLARRLDPLAI